jgi:hypothetical protein
MLVVFAENSTKWPMRQCHFDDFDDFNETVQIQGRLEKKF